MVSWKSTLRFPCITKEQTWRTSLSLAPVASRASWHDSDSHTRVKAAIFATSFSVDGGSGGRCGYQEEYTSTWRPHHLWSEWTVTIFRRGELKGVFSYQDDHNLSPQSCFRTAAEKADICTSDFQPPSRFVNQRLHQAAVWARLSQTSLEHHFTSGFETLTMWSMNTQLWKLDFQQKTWKKIITITNHVIVHGSFPLTSTDTCAAVPTSVSHPNTIMIYSLTISKPRKQIF